MNAGKNKVPLLLMEQLIMVLVFALSATFCIQAFVLSNQISKESQAKDKAVNFAQNVAEVLIENKGDMEKLEEVYGGNAEENVWKLTLDENWNESENEAFTILVNKKDKNEYLGEAKVIVTNQKESTLFEQNIAWQEVVLGE